ncbi:MAG: MFS transporter [Sphingomonadales bacterium]|nr:MFS transporter [Sphingomonadales bacterium]
MNSRRPLVFASFVIFLDALGIGLMMPVMPDLIMEVSGVGLDEAVRIGGYLLLSYAGMQFLFAPMIGAISDKVGRRPVFIAALAMLALDYAIMASAMSLSWLFVGRVLSGLAGSTWAVAFSCAADVVPQEKRGGAFGAVGAAGALGLVLGPVIGGFAGGISTRLPFQISAVLAGGGAIFVILLFQETLSLQLRRALDFKAFNPIGALSRLSRDRFLQQGFVILFIISFSMHTHTAIWSYYGILKFGWSPLQIGLTAAVYGVSMIVVRAGLAGRAEKRMGARSAARWSILFAAPSYAMVAVAPDMTTTILAIVLGSISGIALPMLQALMSQAVHSDEQGYLQGAIASISGLAALLAPLVMSQVLYFSMNEPVSLPGAPFLLVSVLLVGATILLWRATAGNEQAGAKADK